MRAGRQPSSPGTLHLAAGIGIDHVVPLLSFLGAVHHYLRSLDRTGVLASVALASGALLALIWPLAGMLRDVTLEAARVGRGDWRRSPPSRGMRIPGNPARMNACGG